MKTRIFLLVLVALLLVCGCGAPSEAPSRTGSSVKSYSAESTEPVPSDVITRDQALELLKTVMHNAAMMNMFASGVFKADEMYSDGYYGLSITDQWDWLPDYAIEAVRTYVTCDGVEAVFERTFTSYARAGYLNALFGGEKPLYKDVDRSIACTPDVAAYPLVAGEWEIDSLEIIYMSDTVIKSTAVCKLYSDTEGDVKELTFTHESDGWKLDASYAVSFPSFTNDGAMSNSEITDKLISAGLDQNKWNIEKMTVVHADSELIIVSMDFSAGEQTVRRVVYLNLIGDKWELNFDIRYQN